MTRIFLPLMLLICSLSLRASEVRGFIQLGTDSLNLFDLSMNLNFDRDGTHYTNNRYPHVMNYLTHIGPRTKFSYWVQAPDGIPAKMLTRPTNITPLLWTIHRQEYPCAYAIAYTFPACIDDTDSEGNTPLHYLATSLQHLSPTKRAPHNLIRLLMRHINRTNNNGITPIFMAADADAIFLLHSLGADLTEAEIERVRPNYWQRNSTLAMLYACGMHAELLATIFSKSTTTITNRYTEIRPLMQQVSQRDAPFVKKCLLGTSPIIPLVTMREQLGRGAQRELDKRKRMMASAAIHRQTTAKRTQHPDDHEEDEAKHQRTE
jgi:hypothetical protein